MIKHLILLISIMAIFSHANAEDGLSLKVYCSVTGVTGNLSSFVPPKLGSTISFDTSKNKIEELEFSDESYISISQALDNVSLPWMSHLANFTSKQYESSSLTIWVAVQIARFTPMRNSNYEYSGKIQVSQQNKLTGFFNFGELTLQCESINL